MSTIRKVVKMEKQQKGMFVLVQKVKDLLFFDFFLKIEDLNESIEYEIGNSINNFDEVGIQFIEDRTLLCANNSHLDVL